MYQSYNYMLYHELSDVLSTGPPLFSHLTCRLSQQGQKTYFIHRPSSPGSRWPTAFASDPERQVAVTTANKTGANPGLPPGAAFSVASYSSTIEVATLADFDAALPDGLMWSLEDTQGQLDTESMAQVALELARALFIVTAGTGAGPSFTRDVTQARASVQALVGCLAADVPGLVCDLAFEYMYPVGALPKRYVSTYNYPTEDPDTPNYRSDVARLMYNLLGEAVKTPGQNRTAAARCSPYTNKCNQTGMVSGAGGHTLFSLSLSCPYDQHPPSILHFALLWCHALLS